MGALRDCRRIAHAVEGFVAGRRTRFSGERSKIVGKRRERPFAARISNFAYYAPTGVKAQVFVLVLFHHNGR
jgi:hypothetical protein